MDAIDRLIAAQADLDRRLRVLEGGERVGLARSRSVWMTASAAQTTIGPADFTGPAGTTWEDDAGGTGTGWPEVTVVCGERVLIEWAGTMQSVADSTNYRSRSGSVGIRINGVPDVILNPTLDRNLFNGNAFPIDVPLAASAIRTVTPGSNTFKIYAAFANTRPAATIAPTLSNLLVTITPLAVA